MGTSINTMSTTPAAASPACSMAACELETRDTFGAWLHATTRSCMLDETTDLLARANADRLAFNAAIVVGDDGYVAALTGSDRALNQDAKDGMGMWDYFAYVKCFQMRQPDAQHWWTSVAAKVMCAD